MDKKRVCAILLAGGSGMRMRSVITKQQMLIKGKTVLYRALLAFESCPDVTDIILVLKEDEIPLFDGLKSKTFTKLRKTVSAGKTRAESAFLGFKAIDFCVDFVAVHDVARCLILPSDISKVVADAIKYGAASASSIVTDTVKRVDEQGFIVNTEKRSDLRLAGTPQIFPYGRYCELISCVDFNDTEITDDNILFERAGVPVYMTNVGSYNIKITHPEDVALAEYLLEKLND